MLGFNAISETPLSTLNGINGIVADGLLEGATVSRVNLSGNSVTTNASGEFYNLTGYGSIKALGGTDKNTGLTFLGQLTSPDGVFVAVTPVTTLIDALVTTGTESTVSNAVSTIRSALNLPNVDVLTLNPITGTFNGGTASSSDTLAVFKAGLKITETLAQASSLR